MGMIVLVLLAIVSVLAIATSFSVSESVVQPIEHMADTMMKLNAVESDEALKIF
jgi:hypothetical protein